MYYLFVLAILGTFWPVNADQQVPIVEAPIGEIHGYQEIFYANKLNVYMGIPYAVPPVGKRRFERPEELTSLPKKPFMATRPGHHCIQKMKGSILRSDAPMSEDCLFLNIWTPAKCPAKKYPVLFYIPWAGGGIFESSSYDAEEILLDGSPIASLGQVIVVTVNYRIGPLGYLYIKDKVKGNMGYFDQSLALKFIKENIKSFCGDPDLITLFGISAGSFGVGMLLLSPYSNQNFKYGIMESGSPIYRILEVSDSKDDAHLKAIKLAKKANCLTRGQINLKCLKEVDPMELIETTYLEYFTVQDDDFFPAETFENYKKNDRLIIPSDKKILIGITSEEKCDVAVDLATSSNANLTSPPRISKADARRLIKEKTTIKNPQFIKKAIEFYTKDPGVQLDRGYVDSVSHFVNDYSFNCPGHQFAVAASKSIDVYSYVLMQKPAQDYSEKVRDNDWYKASWVGVCHATDTVFVFGLPFRFIDQFLYDDRLLSKKIIQTWAEFARTGALPRLDNKKEWPKANHGHPRYVQLKYGNFTEDSFNFEYRCNEFWKKDVPKLEMIVILPSSIDFNIIILLITITLLLLLAFQIPKLLRRRKYASII